MGKRLSVVIALILFPLVLWAAIPDGQFTIKTGGMTTTLKNTKLVCHIPTGTPADCKNPTSDTTVSLSQHGTDYSINYSGLQAAIFPSNSRCPITAMVCTVNADVLAKPNVSLVDFTVSRLGKWSDGHGGLAWSASISNATSDQESQAYATSMQSEAIAGGYQSIELMLYSAQQGRINLTNDVATPPAQLVCGDHTFIALSDETTKKEYFSLASLFSVLSPNTSPTKHTAISNCSIQDSNPNTPVTYAAIANIQDLGLHDALDDSGSFWAAEIPDVVAANGGNYLVTKTSTAPSKDNQKAFNQNNITFTAITAGKIVFGGDLKDYQGDLYLTCDDDTPMKLTKIGDDFAINLLALHNQSPVTAPNVVKSYRVCTLETDPTKSSKTVFVSFAVSAIIGDYHSTSGSAPMWGATVSDIIPGQSSYTIDTAPVTSTCDVEKSNACNQTTITFNAVKPGYIDIMGTEITTGTLLECPGGYNFKGERLVGGMRYDLKTIHAGKSQDPTTTVNYANCGLVENGKEYGTFDISTLNGARGRPDDPSAKMWSVKITNISGLGFQSSTLCDANDNCNTWKFRDTIG